MSGIWPFFNSSFSNASINKILAQIDLDQQHREQKEQQEQQEQQKRSQQQKSKVKDKSLRPSKPRSIIKSGASSPGSSSPSSPSAQSFSPGSSANATTPTTATTSTAHVSVMTPPSQLPVAAHEALSPASQLLHSIKENDNNLAQSLGQQPAPIQQQQQQQVASPAVISPTITPTISPTATPSGKAGPPSSLPIPSSLSNSLSTSVSSIPPARRISVALLNKLLDQPNLMDEINLAKNQRLINYISHNDVIDVMIDYILYSLDLANLDGDTDSIDLQQEIFVEYVDPEAKSGDEDNGEKNNTSTGGIHPCSEETEDEGEEAAASSEHLTPLEKALQRASVCSEVMILPNTNILPNLMGSTELMTKLWRGFFDRDVDCFFKNCRLIAEESEEEDNDEETEKEEEASSDVKRGETENIDDDSSSTHLINEEQYERSRFKDNHALLMFNNFLKLVDDMATMNMNELMNFIRFEQQHCSLTDQFLKFIPYSPTTCDLLVRLVSTDKPYNPNGLIDILIDQDLILRLFKMTKIYYLDHQVQDNLCNLLNGIVGISSNVGFWGDPSVASGSQQLNEFGEPVEQDQANLMRASNPNVGPNDLTRQLVSKQCVLEMLDIIIRYGNYGLVTVVSVIIEAIRKNNSDYDEFDWIGCVEEQEETETEVASETDTEEADSGAPLTRTSKSSDDPSSSANKNKVKHLPSSRDPIYLGVMLKLFSLHLGEIVENYLTDKYFEIRKVSNLSTATGDVIEPLGYERFKVMELIAELLHCSNMILMNKSLKLDYLIYKRDVWRDVKHTESLVKDALNDSINEKAEEEALRKRVEQISLGNGDGGDSEEERYVDIPTDLSIGNYFKLKLLQTNSIPLIALKMHRFPWNNFMHNVVFDLVQQVFNGRLANWDEDQASNQEETKYDDNLSLNKILIWSLFGDFDHFDLAGDYVNDDKFPGFFNLPEYILFCFKLSEDKEAQTNFKLGYMGHLTLIAEEVHKFQNYVENFGMARDDQTFSLLKEESDSSSVFYLKSSFYVFNTLFERIFESGEFDNWNRFVNTTLKELNSMYNKVLGNPNEIGNSEENGSNSGDSGVVMNEDGIPISPSPINENAIILDNGDSEEFRKGVQVIDGEEQNDERREDHEKDKYEEDEEGEEGEDEEDEEEDDDDKEEDLGGGDLRPMRGRYEEPYQLNDSNEPNENAREGDHS
ncbi:DEKNAAC104901 [Brettanomyces naardenensis]|uniref:DEKNAAC104901 n=1 Tax=Brettanomyces naardenensis TaxID=13370 RepID=A0A448YSB5_BRENA|nr:DEKNAAC104901 [Brettanomyces naardenensis]